MEGFQQRFLKAKELSELRWIDIAKKSGLDKASISQYKNGLHIPEPEALYKLAIVLNVGMEWLTGADVPMEIDRQSLQEKYEACKTCKVIEQRHDSKTYDLVEQFAKLDEADQDKVRYDVELLLADEKYQNIKKES